MKQCEWLFSALLVVLLAIDVAALQASAVAEERKHGQVLEVAAAGRSIGPNRSTDSGRSLASQFTALQRNVFAKPWKDIYNTALHIQRNVFAKPSKEIYKTQRKPLKQISAEAPWTSITSHMYASLVSPNMSSFKQGGRPYDGVMFASGLKHGKRELVAFRVCTNKCSHLGSMNSIGVGEAETSGSQFQITHVSEDFVPHADDGKWGGPEDPRIDEINNRAFISFNMNVQGVSPKLWGCKNYQSGALRKMFFKWLGSENECMLQLPHAPTCQTEKNWASLVPPGNDFIFFVYDLEPLQVYLLNTNTCGMMAETRASEPYKSTYRGSSRYVKGLEVPGGVVYWATVHQKVYRPRPRFPWAMGHQKHKFPFTYKTFIAAILVNGAKYPYDFHMLGTSCEVRMEFADVGKYDFALSSSISTYDMKQDEADVTFHIDDEKVVRSKMLGVAGFLKKAYEHWKNTKKPASCPKDSKLSAR